MATRDLTRRFAELRVLQHGVEGSVSENKRPGDAYSESGLLDVRGFVYYASCVVRVGERSALDCCRGCVCSVSVDLTAHLP